MARWWFSKIWKSIIPNTWIAKLCRWQNKRVYTAPHPLLPFAVNATIVSWYLEIVVPANISKPVPHEHRWESFLMWSWIVCPDGKWFWNVFWLKFTNRSRKFLSWWWWSSLLNKQNERLQNWQFPSGSVDWIALSWWLNNNMKEHASTWGFVYIIVIKI